MKTLVHPYEFWGTLERWKLDMVSRKVIKLLLINCDFFFKQNTHFVLHDRENYNLFKIHGNTPSKSVW